jgi:hypothetical protein
MPNCSKAPRGLFVLLRTDGIFTVNALSPSSSLRQYPYHYAIRAGQNLPDKEFRYLRTVIVTAAVHRGFSSSREAIPLTFRHRAGVSPYTSTFVLAETYVFGKQLHGFLSCSPLTVSVHETKPAVFSHRAGQRNEFIVSGCSFSLTGSVCSNAQIVCLRTALFLICLKNLDRHATVRS